MRFRWVRIGKGLYRSLLGEIRRDARGWTWQPPPHIGGINRCGSRTAREAKHEAEREMSLWWFQ